MSFLLFHKKSGVILYEKKKTSIKIAHILDRYFRSDQFIKSRFDRKDIKKYGDSIVSQRRDEIMRNYAEIMGS